jgi:hypothetical protein
MQLAEFHIHEDDLWLRGFKGHIAEIHSILTYYLSRGGFNETAKTHFELALSLATLPATHKEIVEAYGSGREKAMHEGAYISYVVPHIDEYLDKGDAARLSGDRASAEYFYSRSWLLSPGYVPAVSRLDALDD